MASNTDYLPDEITYGFVADRVLLAIGDTASDDNRYPDGVPAQGTVRFSPQRTILYTQQHPATVLPQDIECTIYHREHPVALEKGYEPELVGKLVDPAGHVGNVALIVGWYDVVYRLSTGTAQRFRFQVKPEHTADNPLWLPEVAPLQPTPSERFVVNEQVYNDTKTARDEAEQFRDTTRTYRNEVETYRDQVETYRDEAGQSATSAAEILSDVQDLGITVDTSVGERIFIGDTMIHGDTGWVDISGSLHEDWELSGLDGIFQIKRENSTVTLVARVTRAPDSPNYATDYSLIELLNTGRSVLPLGFRPFPQYGLYASVQPKDGVAVYLSALSSKNNLRLYSDSSAGTWAPGDSLRFQASWQTDDVWPT